MKNYTSLFRVGRKQKRAMLDANGIEIVIFAKGQEDLAELTCKLLNMHFETKKNIVSYPCSNCPCDPGGTALIVINPFYSQCSECGNIQPTPTPEQVEAAWDQMEKEFKAKHL